MADGHRFPYAGNIHARKFQHPTERVKNQFANDGSFLEMFKKRMEEQMKTNSAKISADDGVNSNIKNTTTASGLLPLVGKRRSDSRRSLKTGIVKKLRTDTSDTADNSSMNASSKYMEEVKRYKATMCVEDEKSRPLVKSFLFSLFSNCHFGPKMSISVAAPCKYICLHIHTIERNLFVLSCFLQSTRISLFYCSLTSIHYKLENPSSS
ncbi:TRIR [Acanthosepion pharaonis]|uniref:TRIR n=1 Tax=Acanthosepion pharaonis TaxID=158019 RepID=A0A812C2Z8_ACAPH|nr:TRIR [Sepia pharaonis]